MERAPPTGTAGVQQVSPIERVGMLHAAGLGVVVRRSAATHWCLRAHGIS